MPLRQRHSTPTADYRSKILLVDDRRENLVALQTILAPLETELFLATSGNAALALTLEHSFAVVLLDVMMPGMDGFETAELLRQNASTRHIPIIFVTAIGTDEKHVFKGYEAGAVDYLCKPLDPDILINKVRVFLELHDRQAALDRANAELHQANQRILAQQKKLIEEERLNTLFRMAAATAHELSQPLTVLLFGINMLEMDRKDPKKTDRHIADIRKAGERISEIVKRIKTVNRYEITPHDRDNDIINLDQTLKILQIEGDRSFAATVRKLLRHENVELTQAGNMREGLQKFRQGHFDMIFLDYLLPDGSGQEFLTNMGNLVQEIPVVVMAGEEDAVTASKLLRAGVYDYLHKKKISIQSLKRVLASTLEKFHLHQEVQRAKTKMAEMLNIDQLTGICSRQHFLQELEEECERVNRYGNELSLLIMDLDEFKEVNQAHGHAMGDEVLTRIGQILQQNKRCNDQTCRYGGEEFAILLPNTPLDSAQTVCEKLRQLIAEQSFAGAPHPFNVTVSIGLATAHRRTTPEELLQQAKEALTNAKEKGRNMVSVYSAD